MYTALSYQDVLVSSVILHILNFEEVLYRVVYTKGAYKNLKGLTRKSNLYYLLSKLEHLVHSSVGDIV